ncbi:hypothetical protein EV360DRAFT_78796 [Lentinula raphanica]|nr:hypothetical protein EV360DRAFT_78796 [Lentinula raphanica]
MGQYWQIISIDNKETLGHLGKLGEVFWSPSSTVISYIRAPVVPSRYKPITRSLEEKPEVQSLASKWSQSVTTPTAPLLALPVELLMIIIEDLGKDYLDLLCFALSCTLLWEITGQTRCDSLCSQLRKESWAGSRIILLGDNAGTLPKSMLTDEELEELGLTQSRPKHRGSELYFGAMDRFRVPSRKDLILGDERVRSNSKLLDELRLARRNERFNRWIEIKRSDFTVSRQNGDRWMIRNLSKREYVTLLRARNLTQVLYTLIGRSNDPAVYMCGGSWLIKGSWAGDRIDLTVVSVHNQEYSDEAEWKDITGRVIERLEKLAFDDGAEHLLLE